MTTVSLPDVLPVAAPADDVAGPPQGHWTYACVGYQFHPDHTNMIVCLNGLPRSFTVNRFFGNADFA